MIFPPAHLAASVAMNLAHRRRYHGGLTTRPFAGPPTRMLQRTGCARPLIVFGYPKERRTVWRLSASSWANSLPNLLLWFSTLVADLRWLASVVLAASSCLPIARSPPFRAFAYTQSIAQPADWSTGDTV